MPMWRQKAPVLGAVLTLLAALIVAFGVIPRVRADAFPVATPNRAATAFWGTALLSLLLAAMAFIAAGLGASRDSLRGLLLGVAGLVTVLIGVLLMDAAGAFSGHGPAMGGVVVALWVCVCFYVAGGLLITASAFVPRGRPQHA